MNWDRHQEWGRKGVGGKFFEKKDDFLLVLSSTLYNELSSFLRARRKKEHRDGAQQELQLLVLTVREAARERWEVETQAALDEEMDVVEQLDADVVGHSVHQGVWGSKKLGPCIPQRGSR